MLRRIRLLQSITRYYNNFNSDLQIKCHNLNSGGCLVRNFVQQNLKIKCWQCGIERTNLKELFCEQCNIIQEPHERQNYFKIFEIPERVDLDQKDLTLKYRKMQSLLHPDKFSTKSDQEKNISEEFSSLVNKAYNTLQSPLTRAIHLLNLKGETIKENQTVEDPEFLMEIMELNEQVESADNPEKLKALNKENRKILNKIIGEINEAFQDNNLINAKKGVIKMKYFNSVQTHINHLLREKGIIE